MFVTWILCKFFQVVQNFWRQEVLLKNLVDVALFYEGRHVTELTPDQILLNFKVLDFLVQERASSNLLTNGRVFLQHK